MHKTILTATFLLVLLAFNAVAQDLEFARTNIRKLTSPEFQGRGYVRNGDKIAADYLAGAFKTIGLKAFVTDYFQLYTFNINTFPGHMDVTLDGKVMEPARDFLINPASRKCRGNFKIMTIDKRWLSDTVQLKTFFNRNFRNTFILIDTAGWGKDNFRHAIWEAVTKNVINARGIIEVADTGLIFSARTFQNTFTSLLVRRRALPANLQHIRINISQKYLKHTARNLIGFIPGETDSFIVFTAHYDHLGRMGKATYFPGANDNASGTSMVLDFARTLSQKKGSHRYSYAFMLFSGEEAGLLGSQFYVEHPLFPLSKIKQLLNFDMVGTGSGGVNVFNGSVLKQEFALLDTINKANHLGINLKLKSPSRGSDHYSFYQKQVPALFLLTDGKEVGYHVPQDTYEKLPFTAYEQLFKLIIQYIEAKENGEIIHCPDSRW